MNFLFGSKHRRGATHFKLEIKEHNKKQQYYSQCVAQATTGHQNQHVWCCLSCGYLTYSSYHHVPFIRPELVFLKMVSLFICILFTFPLLSSIGTFFVYAWLGCIVYKFNNWQLFRYWFCFCSLMYFHCKVTCILPKHGCRILVTFTNHIFSLTYTFLKCSRLTTYSQRVMRVTQPENAQYRLFRNLTGDVYFSPGMFAVTEIFMMPSSWKSVWVCLNNIFEFFLTYNCSKTWSCNGQYCFSRAQCNLSSKLYFELI